MPSPVTIPERKTIPETPTRTIPRRNPGVTPDKTPNTTPDPERVPSTPCQPNQEHYEKNRSLQIELLKKLG